MLGDLTKSILDTTYGKNRPQTYNNVLIEAMDNVGTTTANLVQSIREEGFKPETFIEAASQIAEDNIQAYRIALAHLSADKKEDIERANKLRDLRVFNTTHGNPITDLSSPFRAPLQNQETRQYKRTSDISEANELLPALLGKAIEQSQGKPERLRTELQKLKRNSYQTMPSPSSMPESFLNYLNFLKQTQGDEAAIARLKDYIQQNSVNKAKSAMVPSL
jgi:hypothetical protein